MEEENQNNNQQNIQQDQPIQGTTDFPFLLPGQPLSLNTDYSYNTQIYHPKSNQLISLYAGYPLLKNSKNTQILNLQKFAVQYMPAKNQIVIGKVKVRTAESFIVDFYAPLDGNLGALEFDGATKRNKPNLQTGDLVYARVVEYSKFLGGKLSCLNKGFTSKKSGNELGQLKGGAICEIPAYKHSNLHPYLQKIGKCVKFQAAMGKNGIVWIQTARSQNIMLIINILKFLANEQELQKEQKDEIFSKMLSMIK